MWRKWIWQLIKKGYVAIGLMILSSIIVLVYGAQSNCPCDRCYKCDIFGIYVGDGIVLLCFSLIFLIIWLCLYKNKPLNLNINDPNNGSNMIGPTLLAVFSGVSGIILIMMTISTDDSENSIYILMLGILYFISLIHAIVIIFRFVFGNFSIHL